MKLQAPYAMVWRKQACVFWHSDCSCSRECNHACHMHGASASSMLASWLHGFMASWLLEIVFGRRPVLGRCGKERCRACSALQRHTPQPLCKSNSTPATIQKHQHSRKASKQRNLHLVLAGSLIWAHGWSHSYSGASVVALMFCSV
jgi:hypothetical protein